VYASELEEQKLNTRNNIKSIINQSIDSED